MRNGQSELKVTKDNAMVLQLIEVSGKTENEPSSSSLPITDRGGDATDRDDDEGVSFRIRPV